MTIVPYVAALFLITLVGHGQVPQKYHRTESSSQSEITVRRLYQQVVSQPFGGIPTLERMKVLSPDLSSLLIHRISQARACGNDWFRLHPQNDVKAPLTWLEFGLFSGANDRSGPRTFQIEKSETEGESSARVYVRLTGGTPPETPWTWEVAVIVIRENERFVINDVVFLRDKDVDTESRLSEILSEGCDGPRWVGFKEEQNHPK